MVLVFEGFATLCAFKLAIASSLGQHLMLISPWLVRQHMALKLRAIGECITAKRAGEVLFVLLVAVLDVLLE